MNGQVKNGYVHKATRKAKKWILNRRGYASEKPYSKRLDGLSWVYSSSKENLFMAIALFFLFGLLVEK